MKGIFWNSRGLVDLAKRRFLRDTSVEEKLDFIALLETGRDNFPPRFLNTIFDGTAFDWHVLPPRDRSGGILLRVKGETLHVFDVVQGECSVKFHIRSKIDSFHWDFVV